MSFWEWVFHGWSMTKRKPHHITLTACQCYTLTSSCGCRISPKGGAPTPRWGGGYQHTTLPNFLKNCMKLKEFGPSSGSRCRVRGARNMKSMRLPLAAIFLWLIFMGLGRPWSPQPPLELLLGPPKQTRIPHTPLDPPLTRTCSHLALMHWLYHWIMLSVQCKCTLIQK